MLNKKAGGRGPHQLLQQFSGCQHVLQCIMCPLQLSVQVLLDGSTQCAVALFREELCDKQAHIQAMYMLVGVRPRKPTALELFAAWQDQAGQQSHT